MSIETLKNLVESGAKLTPMMKQYFEIKINYQDIFLLFRMGDFYEVFFDDAVEISALLNITLTHRGKIGDFKIPMAGIPHHAATNYIDRLTNLGHKTAICEQIEDPKDAIGIVKRAVTQVASPGMPFDLEKANSSDYNFIVSAFKDNKHYYLSAIDFTTGDFKGLKTDSKSQFLEKIDLLSPKEFILFMGQWDDFSELQNYLKNKDVLTTYLESDYFETTHTKTYIEKLIPSYQFDNVITASLPILNSIGALSYYICSTQNIDKFSHISPFKMDLKNNSMGVTRSTLEGLEIIPRNIHDYKKSLLGHCDKTVSALGKRLLKSVFLSPLTTLLEIEKRQQMIDHFVTNDDILALTREELKKIRDLERIMAKITTKKVTPNDLINLSNTINSYREISKILNTLPKNIIKSLSKEELKKLITLKDLIEKTISDEPGASIDKGNLIRVGVDKKRDRLKKLSSDVIEELIRLETKYRKKTGIVKLRIKSNNVFGHFIEIPKSKVDEISDDFIRKQTLTNAERYTTTELSEFEKEIISAKENLERLERKIFNSIINEVSLKSLELKKLSRILAYIDVFSSLSKIALEEDFTKPEIKNNTQIIDIEGGWHPLIKAQIQDKFVQHDLHLDKNCFFGLITGPNMAGKTTVMREVAIIQLLSQIGSFVPANKATLGICDSLFSRLGASDDITRGQSTFMMEMSETAEILRHATSKSLIILDEVGRGTSTNDGLSIAWALVEHFINKTKALTLFSTHYHELIKVVEKYPGSKNLTVEIVNQGDEIHFLYRLLEQGTAESFGIYVAKLAGIPNSVLKRSKNLLNSMEERSVKPTLFDGINRPNPHLKNDDIKNDLKKINLLQTTPIEAINILHDLQSKIDLLQ